MSINNLRDSWRILAYYDGKYNKSSKKCDEQAPTGFDEVVVGKWLHLERMNTGYWWMRLGNKEADITVDTRGRATVVWREEE